MAANLVVWCEILEAQWSVYKKLHELSITNLCLILGIMNEAAKQATNGHGAEDSGMAKKKIPASSQLLAVAGRDGHQAANC